MYTKKKQREADTSLDVHSMVKHRSKYFIRCVQDGKTKEQVFAIYVQDDKTEEQVLH